MVLCITLIFLAFSFLLETKDYIEMQKDMRPYVYRLAEYYNINQDGKYLLRDDLGYIWVVQVEIDRGYTYLIKVNLGQDYDSKEDDILESLWVKLQ